MSRQWTGTRFNWKIENYSSHYQVTGKKITSSIFYSENGYKDQWCLEMYPKGQDESTKDSVSIYLKLIRTSKTEINANVKFVMLKPGFDHEPGHDRVCNMSDIIWIQGSREGILDFAKSSELREYVNNDTLQLSCEIEFISDIKNGSDIKPRRLSEESGTVKHRLTDDLWQIFNDKKFSDTIITVGDTQFHVHKLILQTRSPILAEKLPDKTKKYHHDEILIDDIKPEVVLKMLQFMYTDKIDNFEGMLEDLLKAADQYGLNSLKSLCEKHLCDSVDVDNVGSTLVIGDQCHAHVLTNYCSKFILSHLTEFIKTPGWLNIEENYPELACFLINTWGQKSNILEF